MTFQCGAFQTDAFQNNCSDGGAGEGNRPKLGFFNPYEYKYLRKKHKKRVRRINEQYKQVAEVVKPKEKNKLISLIDPYVQPVNEEEEARREQGKFILSDIPDISRIDLLRLVTNQFALKRFLEFLAIILMELKKRREEEDLLLILALTEI